MIYGITPIKDSSALDQRYEFITAKNSGIFVCGAKANYCLDSNQISWTANIIYLLLCWIIPPLRFPKGPFPPPPPPMFVHTTQGGQKLLQDRNLSQRLGKAKGRSIVCRKVSFRVRWGKVFPRKGGKSHFHGQMASKLYFLLQPSASVDSVPASTTAQRCTSELLSLPHFPHPLHYFSHH